jgi:hypothetical protein
VLREELFHQVNQYKFHHRYLNFSRVKSLTLRTTFVILRGLLEENNNCLLVLKRKYAFYQINFAIGDNICTLSPGTVSGDSIQRSKKLR